LRNKRNILFLFLLSTYFAAGQVMPNPRQVISTTGGTSGGSFTWGTLDFTVGEPMGQTYTSGTPFTIKTITQGFQQPENNTLFVTQASVNSTCQGANNGSIALTVINATGTLTYSWLPSVGNSGVVTNLAPGTYQYTITDSISSVTGVVTISEDPVPCATGVLTFYTGITPNGDGNNDFWVIDSITNFPDNEVSIFNRWGDMVWHAKNYDNVNVVWGGDNRNGNSLPDATYFYFVEIPEQKFKGWVELTH
jgi:gliding motility-associated-like protein